MSEIIPPAASADIDSANAAKSGGVAVLEFSEDAVLWDGTLLADAGPHAGGIVTEPGKDGTPDTLYSLAASHMVYGGQEAAEEHGPGQAIAKRVGKVSILEAGTPTEGPRQRTLGLEFESTAVDPETGDYVDSGELPEMNETFRFQLEKNVGPTADPEEFRGLIRGMMNGLAEHAEARGTLAAPLATFGHRVPTREELNPNKYFMYTGDVLMAPHVGVTADEGFRYGGTQFHISGRDTAAMLQVNEAMAYGNSIFATALNAGPFMLGGEAGRIADQGWADINDVQRYHYEHRGLTPADFHGPYHSQRALWREAGSPSGGIQEDVAPENIQDYLKWADEELGKGNIISLDRVFGMHRSRQRTVLDGKGANTYEFSDLDTGNGNEVIIPEVALLAGAVYTHLEDRLVDHGEDPRDTMAELLGISGLSQAARLQQAGREYVTEAGRHGNDARLFGKTPAEWLPDLYNLIGDDPHGFAPDRDVLTRAYASNADTREAIRTSGVDPREAVKAYHDLNIGSPSTYMQVQNEALQEDGVELAEDRVRTIQRDIGRAFMQHNQQVA